MAGWLGGVAARGRRLVAEVTAPLGRLVLLHAGERTTVALLAGARLIGLRPRATAGLMREARRHTLAGDEDRALDLAERAARAYPDDLRLTDLLIGLLDRASAHDRALGLAIDNAARHLARLETLRDHQLPPRQLDRAHRILVSGYFHSGSGAVLDYLRDFPGTVKWAPTGELRLLKFPGGFDDLLTRHEAQGRLTARDLVEHYLHLTGRRITTVPDGTYDEWEVVNRNSRRMYRRAHAAGYLAALLRGFLELATAPASSATRAALENHLCTWLERALDTAATDSQAEYLLIDQAITGRRFDLARIVPPSTIVSVHRDPRDQYAELLVVLAQPGREELDLDGFAARYRAYRERVSRLAPVLEREHGHRIVRIGFEEFVIDHAREAARLCGALGFDPDVRVPNRFDPERSRANIGKHVNVLDHRARGALEAALPEFLSPLADLPGGRSRGGEPTRPGRDTGVAHRQA